MDGIVKLFILGLPGSGKSALARFISTYVQEHQRIPSRHNDYSILMDMFHRDTAGRFKPAKPYGFDVLDWDVFDEALQTLEQQVNIYIASLKLDEKRVALIEFSRNNYVHAFQQFDPLFLKDAYFLYLDTELERCKQRISDRAAKPENREDDYPVSEYIFEKYYCEDDWAYISGTLEDIYGADKDRIWTFNNNHSYDTACMEIEPYIKKMLNCKTQEDSLELAGTKLGSR